METSEWCLMEGVSRQTDLVLTLHSSLPEKEHN